MTKFLFIFFIIAFWVFLPIGYMIVDRTDFNSMDLDELSSVKKPSFIDYITISIKVIGFYFQIFSLGLPNMPNIVNFFLFFLKAVSALIVIILAKGE